MTPRPPTHAHAPLPVPALLCALLCVLAVAAPLCAAELAKPPVPDPFGLGERLALIDYLQQTFKAKPAQGATLEELSALYWQLSARAQAAARPSDELLTQDRIARLRRELKDGFTIDPPATAGEDELVHLLGQARQQASDNALQEVLAHAEAHDQARSAGGAGSQQAEDTAARARQGRFGAEARAKQGELDGVQGALTAALAELHALQQRIAGLGARQQDAHKAALQAEDAGKRESAAAGAVAEATQRTIAATGQALAEATTALTQAQAEMAPLLARGSPLTRDRDRLRAEIEILAKGQTGIQGGLPAGGSAAPVVRGPPPAAPGSMEERLKATVVLLAVKERGTGTGFFVTSSGLLVTNAHVVGDGKAEITALWDVGANHPPVVMEMVKLRPDADLALLRATDGRSYLTLEMREHYELARPLLAAGFPLAGAFARSLMTSPSDIVVSRGALSAVRKRGPVAEWLQHDCKIASGNSGGPLIDQEDGSVIGINSRVVDPAAVGAHGDSMSLAIPISKVLECFSPELGR
jgi:S1-C subfamily serine protease